jgi:hypothetical protein
MDKSYSEIKQIAVDMAENKIFSNLHINKLDYSHMIMVFMPLIFLDEEQRKNLAKQKYVFAYEYYSEAGPRGVNGMPTFTSVRFLNEEDYQTMWTEYTKYCKIKQDFLDDYNPVIPFQVGDDFLTQDDLKK